MGSFSDYLENALLDHVFEGSAYTQPVHTWIALTTHLISDSESGGNLRENSLTGAYARRVCLTWDAASGGATANTEDLTFAQATDDWGIITTFAIMDTATVDTGNILAYGTLTISKSVQSGDTPKFATGDLDITLT